MPKSLGTGGTKELGHFCVNVHLSLVENCRRGLFRHVPAGMLGGFGDVACGSGKRGLQEHTAIVKAGGLSVATDTVLCRLVRRLSASSQINS